MRKLLVCIAAALAALLPSAQARAQQAEEQAVRAVVDRLFTGMRQADSAAVRSVFHPQARLATVAVRPSGETVVREEMPSAFVQAVGTPHDQVWDERISNVQVRIDGPLAMAWMDYSFYLGSQLSHCGVNLFQLAKVAEGWKIISITDTRRREGCQPAAG